jgi:hypothetical protein
MFKIQRIENEEREQIPKEHRCEVSYNGYHQWEIIRDTNGLKSPHVICKKCLEKRNIDLTE